ncbi:MAG: glycosyltransferase [Nanoarchaeota archaeon]|nr:glycosyltransferase [Nanoarchaeota archaeon]
METSIIIPTLNDSEIYHCLEEIIKTFPKKTSKNKEILVVNDKNSSKNYSRELKNFCKKKKVRYFQSEKPGASSNRNLGMKRSKGKNILFIDSDCFPEKNWITEMEKGLIYSDLVEGKVIYASKKKPLFDRMVENKNTKNRFLTANLGMKRKVAESLKFDDRFIVFREDTDFGLSAIEKGFKASFLEKAIVFHKKSRFTVKKFILERKRYIGEPLLFKKHKSNPLLKKHITYIWRIVYPLELITLLLFFIMLFFNPLISLVLYFIPGFVYNLKGYLIQGRNFSLKDSLFTLFLIPLTMFVKRIYIWKGAIKFKFFLI